MAQYFRLTDQQITSLSRILDSEKPDNLQHEVEVLHHQLSVNVSNTPVHLKPSLLTEWAEGEIRDYPWPRVSGLVLPPICPMRSRFSFLLDSFTSHNCLFIEGSVGCGRSIMAPAIAYEGSVVQKLKADSSGNRWTTAFKAIHLTANSAQASNFCKYASRIYPRRADMCGLFFGFYTNDLDRLGGQMNSLDRFDTNYLYTTHALAKEAFTNSSWYNVVVLDEIYDLSPTVIKMLNYVKESRNRIDRVIVNIDENNQHLHSQLVAFFRVHLQTVKVYYYTQSGVSPITVKPAGIDDISRFALLSVDGTFVPTELFNLEKDVEGSPMFTVLRNRVVALAAKLTAHVCHSGHAESDILVIVPRDFDAIELAEDYRRNISVDNNLKDVDVIIINEFDPFLSLLEPQFNRRLRVVFSTLTMLTGICAPGFKYVIDCGVLEKVERTRQGANTFRLVWMDRLYQARIRGLVGRLSRGEVFECMSPIRSQFIADDKVGRNIFQFQNADLAYFLKYYATLISLPQLQLYDSLMLETGIMGFFRVDHFNHRMLSLNNLPQIDVVGSALSHVFGSLPSLDLGNFLLYCSAYGVLLHGVALVASIVTHHCAHSKDAREDSIDRALKFWTDHVHELFNDEESDMMVFSNMIVNLLVNDHASYLLPQSQSVKLPDCSHLMETLGLFKIYTVFRRIVKELITLRVIDNDEQLFDFDRNGIDMCIHGEYEYVTLTKDNFKYLNIAILSSFGHRVLFRASEPEQDDSGYSSFILNISRRFNVVKGMMANPTRKDVAVYYSVIRDSTDVNHLKSLIHQSTSMDFLLHGHCYGSLNDIVDKNRGSITIRTNTQSSVYLINSSKVIDLVMNYRRNQKLIPAAVILRNQNFLDLMKRMTYVVHHHLKYSIPSSRCERIQDHEDDTVRINDYHYFESFFSH